MAGSTVIIEKAAELDYLQINSNLNNSSKYILNFSFSSSNAFISDIVSCTDASSFFRMYPSLKSVKKLFYSLYIISSLLSNAGQSTNIASNSPLKAYFVFAGIQITSLATNSIILLSK